MTCWVLAAAYTVVFGTVTGTARIPAIKPIPSSIAITLFLFIQSSLSVSDFDTPFYSSISSDFASLASFSRYCSCFCGVSCRKYRSIRSSILFRSCTWNGSAYSLISFVSLRVSSPCSKKYVSGTWNAALYAFITQSEISLSPFSQRHTAPGDTPINSAIAFWLSPCFFLIFFRRCATVIVSPSFFIVSIYYTIDNVNLFLLILCHFLYGYIAVVNFRLFLDGFRQRTKDFFLRLIVRCLPFPAKGHR